MHEYEMMYILHPRLAADEVTGAIERVNEAIASQGGEVLSVDNWGRRRLAYPIAHQLEGTYVLATLRLSPEATAPLEAGLRISEDVIRHLLIRGIIPYEGPPTQEERGRSQRSAPGEPESAGSERPTAAAEPVEAATAVEAEPEAPQPAEPQSAEASADTAGAGEPNADGGDEAGPQAEGERADGSVE